MRIRQVNEIGEQRFELVCNSFDCKYSPEGVTIVIWQKEEYRHDRNCDKCGEALHESMRNWKQFPGEFKIIL